MRDLRGSLVIVAAGLLLMAFATPARLLWAASGLGWWAPFLIWAAAIVALGLASRAPDDGRHLP